MNYQSIQEVETELAKYVPIVKKITGKDITLQRVEPLMKRLGNPEKKLKIIHVAGTSGKTSTCYYLAAMLQGSVGKVGLTVSPHVDSLTERLQIDGQPVGGQEFCRAFSEFMELTVGVEPEPSYFELLIGLAYWYFDKAGVDYAVVETGFGGTHDATNIAQNPNKICVITDIGFDHMHILGHTLPEIASQKAGIIHAHNQVYMYEQTQEVMTVFRQRAELIGANLTTFQQDELEEKFSKEGLEQLPLYQQRNWLLARGVYEAVSQSEAWDASNSLASSLSVQIPGRMESHEVDTKTVVMDGAHNEQKVEAFVESFKAKYPGQKADILLALKEGKEYEAVLPLLVPLCAKLILTTFDVIQDLPAKSIDPELLMEAARQVGIEDIVVVKDPGQAFRTLLQEPGDLAIVTGSFYLLTAVRPLILK